MINIIGWTILAVFGLLYIICIIGPIATVKEESKNSYLLLLCLFFTFICIFPIKEIYSPLIASRVWQISFGAVLLDSILLIALCKEDRYNAIITALICGGLTFLPFYKTLNFSNDTTPLIMSSEKIEIHLDYLISVIGLCVSLIIIVCSIIIMKRTSRANVNYKLADLLQKNISIFARQDSFNKPMETLWSYEINSRFKQLEMLLQKCMFEIQSLPQKSSFPNKFATPYQDDLRPLIYNMSSEISRINSLLANKNDSNDSFSDFSVIRELNHSLATPLSQIEVNCQLLKTKTKSNVTAQLDRIIQYVNFCRNTISAYKEILSSSVIGDSSDYSVSLNDSFNMYCEKYHKQNLVLNLSAENNIGISKNILMSLLSPLLENAVTASPDGKEIKLQVSQSDKTITIILENECAIVPQIQDLKKGGFSSKKNHIGTGLETVRHFLVLLKGKELQISIDKKIVKFIINIPAK
ncbi:MAG: GHKL domain-containing protein [Paramuribaculum sp.]|nr:GHKL domain-containing protein [Paramuribaculum sp.]